MTVSDIAATDVVTAAPNTPITDIAGTLASEDVGTVVIVDEDDPVGILTDRKIALALQDTADVSDLEASDLMTEDLVTVEGDTGIFDVIRTMSEEGIRRIPIVDDGRLSGIVSLDDVIVLLSSEFENAADVIEKQSRRL